MPISSSSQPLAIFDLDNTLIAGDSDHAWGNFLVSKGKVDPSYYQARNDQFYRDYQQAQLNIHEYLQFVSEPLISMTPEELETLQAEFLQDIIRPLYLSKAQDLLAQHRDNGDYLLIITATNSIVAGPIAQDLGVDEFLATELERREGRITGKIKGTPCYQDGKVLRLQQWLKKHQYQPGTMHFYSDSINDRPLLEYVDFPVVVDGDEALVAHAKRYRWPLMSLRA